MSTGDPLGQGFRNRPNQAFQNLQDPTPLMRLALLALLGLNAFADAHNPSGLPIPRLFRSRRIWTSTAYPLPCSKSFRSQSTLIPGHGPTLRTAVGVRSLRVFESASFIPRAYRQNWQQRAVHGVIDPGYPGQNPGSLVTVSDTATEFLTHAVFVFASTAIDATIAVM
jgi:hypothetical protein